MQYKEKRVVDESSVLLSSCKNKPSKAAQRMR